MKTFIRRLSSRGDSDSNNNNTTTNSSSASSSSSTIITDTGRQAPHGGGHAHTHTSGRLSPGMAPKVVDFAAAWGRVHATLEQLTTGEGEPTAEASWLALYTDVYRICTCPAGGLGMPGGVGGGGGGGGGGLLPSMHGMGMGMGPTAGGGAGSSLSTGTSGVHRRLYDQLHDFLCRHCEAVVGKLQGASASHTAFDFLALYAQLFKLYTEGMADGGKLLAYLDRFWITKHHHKKGIDPCPGVMFIAELVPLIWRQRVLREEISALIQHAFNAVVADLREDPAGPAPEHLEVLGMVVQSFVSLGKTLEPLNPVGFYKEQLEDHLLKQVYIHYAERAGTFAAQVSSGQVDEATVAEYIRVVQRCIQAEEAIWKPVYPSTSRGAVRVVRKSMLESEPHHEILMAFANAALAFRAERLEDLELLYRLLDNDDVDPTKGMDALRQIFFVFVKELGAREVKRANQEARLKKLSPLRPDMSHMLARSSLPADYVSSDAIQMMLDLYSHYLNLVRVTFGEDARFSKAFKTACEHFINHLPNMSESLAIHSHYFLSRDCPESRTESIEVALDSIILLFNFIQDKDLFHRSYARLLASRIINFSSVSDDAERRMMKHLMQVCGFQYAMTFQRMFMDKTLSVELSSEYRKWEREQVEALMDVDAATAAERERERLAGGEGGGGGGGGKKAGHGRRKSDSGIEFVETESGHVTPKSVSPKLNHGMRFIGLHDASPLQVLLAKRVFADKSKKYKTDPHSHTLTHAHSLGPMSVGPGVGPSSSSTTLSATAAAAAGGVSAMGGRAPPYRAHTYFFGDDEFDTHSPAGGAAGGGGGMGGGKGGGLWSTSVLDAQYYQQQQQQRGGEPAIEFFAFILTGGSWPYQTSGPLMELPPPLARCVDSFSAFYDAKYKRRRLTWLHDLGHGEVLFHMPPTHTQLDEGGPNQHSTYTLNVSTYQISLLLLFNRQASWSVDDLLQGLDLDFQELILCLYPLIKAQVLLVAPHVDLASHLTRTHTVNINDTFRCRFSRLAIPRKCDEAELPSTLDSPRSMDPGRISPSLLNERKSAIEARVVHLMKKAGEMRHEKLIEGVLEHTRRMNFVPPVDFICEVIRSDIEKDFLELVEDGPNPLYRYQA